MNRLKTLAAALTTAAAFGLSGTAMAVPCSGVGVDSATTDDVTFNSGGGVRSADACIVFAGNLDSVSSPTNLWTDFNSVPFGTGTFSKVSAGATLFGSFTITEITADINDPEGAWTIKWTGGPAVLDLVAGFKASNEYAVFLFNDQPFGASGTGEGTFKIQFALSASGNGQDLSNFSIWWRNGSTTTRVPEPGSLALLGLGGLIAAAVVRRRRDKSAA